MAFFLECMNIIKRFNDEKVTWELCHSLHPTRPLEILTYFNADFYVASNDMKHSVLAAAAEFLACSNIKSRNADWTLHAIFVRSMIHQHSWRLATMHCKVCSYMIIYIDWLAQLSHPLSLGKWCCWWWSETINRVKVFNRLFFFNQVHTSQFKLESVK